MSSLPTREPSPELVAALIERVRTEGALKAKTAIPKKLDRAGTARLLERLAAGGVEHSGTNLRWPPIEQLRAALRRGPVREKDLARTVRGTTSATERKRLVETLLKSGELVRARRGKDVWLCAPHPDLLDERECKELAALGAELAALTKAMKPGKAGAASMWRTELAPVVERLRALSARKQTVAQPRERVLRALALLGRDRPLVSVPELVRTVRDDVPTADVRRVLLALDREGLVELRAESGIGLLSPDEASLCPIGPDGIPLSYLRRLDGGAHA